jgi:chemotaxis protein MotB
MSRRKKGHAEGAHADERWVISYADLVTLLFGFFILLYATAQTDVVKFAALSRGLSEAFHVPVKNEGSTNSILPGSSGIVSGKTDISRITSDLEFVRGVVSTESDRAGVPGQILVSREDDHIVIRMADHLIFPSASADLRDGSGPLLDIVAKAVKGLSNEIRIEGHTDNVPVGTERYPTNWELSSARATAVLRTLVERSAIASTRVFAAGYGEQRPIATNLTPEGRALNRRADIVILYTSARIPTTTSPAGSNGASPSTGQESH